MNIVGKLITFFLIGSWKKFLLLRKFFPRKKIQNWKLGNKLRIADIIQFSQYQFTNYSKQVLTNPKICFYKELKPITTTHATQPKRSHYKTDSLGHQNNGQGAGAHLPQPYCDFLKKYTLMIWTYVQIFEFFFGLSSEKTWLIQDFIVIDAFLNICGFCPDPLSKYYLVSMISR